MRGLKGGALVIETDGQCNREPRDAAEIKRIIAVRAERREGRRVREAEETRAADVNIIGTIGNLAGVCQRRISPNSIVRGIVGIDPVNPVVRAGVEARGARVVRRVAIDFEIAESRVIICRGLNACDRISAGP